VSVQEIAAGEPAADGRSTRWDDHTAERRQRILDAAIESIAESGDTVAVRDIADRAGVPRSVVYRIFADRDDLDEQVRAAIVERMMTVLAPTLEPNGTIHASVNEAATTYVAWVAKHPRLHQFLGTGSAKRRTTGSRVVTGTRSAIARQLTNLLQQVAKRTGSNPAAAEPLAFGLIGLVDGAVNRWVNNPRSKVSADELSRFLADSVWVVLRAEAAQLGVSLTRRTRYIDVL
jgi:AcrR family transcriptional regulator